MVAGWARESILLDLLRFKEFRPSSNTTVSVKTEQGPGGSLFCFYKVQRWDSNKEDTSAVARRVWRGLKGAKRRRESHRLRGYENGKSE